MLSSLPPPGAYASDVNPRLTAVALALSSATDTAVSDPAVRTGASFTAVTVTLKFSVNVLTFGFVLEPLSVTVMLMLPVPFALAKVL